MNKNNNKAMKTDTLWLYGLIKDVFMAMDRERLSKMTARIYWRYGPLKKSILIVLYHKLNTKTSLGLELLTLGSTTQWLIYWANTSFIHKKKWKVFPDSEISISKGEYGTLNEKHINDEQDKWLIILVVHKS